MKILHNKKDHFVAFIPSGKFVSKLRGIMKLINYKVFEMQDTYIFKKLRSKKRHITYLPSELKQKHNDILVIYKFKKKKKYRVKNDPDDSKNYYYRNFMWSVAYPVTKPTPENLLKFSCYHIIEHMQMMQENFKSDEFAPLHSLIFKFI